MTEKLCKTCAYWEANPANEHVGECKAIHMLGLKPKGEYFSFKTEMPTTGLSSCDLWGGKTDD